MHCMNGKGVSAPHFAKDETCKILPNFDIDYGFLGTEGEESTAPLLVGEESVMEAVFTHSVEQKGTAGGNYPVKCLVDDLDWLGHKRVAMKSDQEPSILDVKSAVKAQWRGEIVPEESPVGDSQSNGRVERAVRSAQEQVRVLKSALDARYGKKVPGDHAVLPWLMDYSGILLTRFRVGSDGKTAYQRVKGKPFKLALPEFGENVLFMLPRTKTEKKHKMDPKFETGIYVGLRQNSNELYVGNDKGVIKVRTIRRLPPASRWDNEMFGKFKGLPWRPQPDSDSVEVRARFINTEIDGSLARPIVVNVQEYRPRRVYIRADKELVRYGVTVGCEGCHAAEHGLPRLRHNEECRKRIIEEMKKDEEGRARLEQAEQRRERAPAIGDDMPQKRKRPGAASAAEGAAEEDQQPALDGGIDAEMAGPAAAVRANAEGGASASSSGARSHFGSVRQHPGAEAASSSARGAKRSAEDAPDDPRAQNTDAADTGQEAPTDMEVKSLGSLDLILEHRRLAELYDEKLTLLMKLGEASVGEVYSPPRVTARSSQFGVRPCFAMDLTEMDPFDNKPWDFSQPEKQTRAWARMRAEQPTLLVGSPPCTPFSQLQALNYPKMKPEHAKKMMQDGITHLEFCISLYQYQAEYGRYWLHEHPDGATSWAQERMQALLSRPDTLRVKGDMCAHGMTSMDWDGEGLVRKTTGWATNSPRLAERLSARCTNSNEDVLKWVRQDYDIGNYVATKGKDGPDWKKVIRRSVKDLDSGKVVRDDRGVHEMDTAEIYAKLPKGVKNIETTLFYREDGEPWHRHVHLLSGRAAAAAIYPPQLVNNILLGLKEQLEEDGKLVASMDAGPVCQEHDIPWYNTDVDLQDHFDSVSGKLLDPEKVREARLDELKEIYKVRHTGLPLYEKRKISECLEKTGRRPIPVKWVDVNKGDEERPEYRSRLVAKEIARDKRDDLFSSTPPLESLRLLLSLARTGRRRDGKTRKLQFLDVSRAHFCARATRDIYVALCPEDVGPGEEDMCAKLHMSMYGTRDAPINWETEYAEFFEDIGFVRGLGNASLFYHPVRDLMTTVHGDDFTSLAEEEQLDWLLAKMRERYEVKQRALLGPDPSDDKEIRILNRLVSWKEDMITYEADPRHLEILEKQLGLETASSVTVPGEAAAALSDSKVENVLLYRSCCMRACYLAQDRPDIAFAAKECARGMHTPYEHHMKALKKLVRYLKGKPRLVWQYADQEKVNHFTVYTDTDDAGCKVTRKSTSSVFAFHGQHLIKAMSSTQAAVALSSGESEFYGVVRGSSAGIGLKAMSADLGMDMGLDVHTDSSAAKSMSTRRGFGKAKHISRGYLWIQQRVRDAELKVRKCGTLENVADIGTKHLPAAVVEKHIKACSLIFATGSSQHALKA